MHPPHHPKKRVPHHLLHLMALLWQKGRRARAPPPARKKAPKALLQVRRGKREAVPRLHPLARREAMLLQCRQRKANQKRKPPLQSTTTSSVTAVMTNRQPLDPRRRQAACHPFRSSLRPNMGKKQVQQHPLHPLPMTTTALVTVMRSLLQARLHLHL